MFRSSEPSSPLDDVVIKATSETLTQENWEYIMDVCDRVNDDPEAGASNAVISLIKRLNHKNANVQIYALTLAMSLAQNCGSKMHREFASKSFTSLLQKIALDKTVHQTVKVKLIEVMQEMSKQFASDPSLRLMSDALSTIQRKNPDLVEGAKRQHQVQKPSKLYEQEQEEADLRAALELSLKESQAQQTWSQPATRTEYYQEPSSRQERRSEGYYEQPANKQQQRQNGDQVSHNKPHQETQPPEKKKPSIIHRVRAVYDLQASEAGELSFKKGDIIQVIESVYKDWWRGSLRGQVGIFPLNYVQPLPDPTPAEIAREAQEEIAVFGQSRNIEKLLALLSSTEASTNAIAIAENEELQNLYHVTVAVRPKLVKLIDKYSQKKDDLIALNEKFLTARKTYDNLMEESLSRYTRQQQQHQQQQIPQMPSVQQSQYSAYGVKRQSVAPYPVDTPSTPSLGVPKTTPYPTSPQVTETQQQPPNYYSQPPVESYGQNSAAPQSPYHQDPATAAGHSPVNMYAQPQVSTSPVNPYARNSVASQDSQTPQAPYTLSNYNQSYPEENQSAGYQTHAYQNAFQSEPARADSSLGYAPYSAGSPTAQADVTAVPTAPQWAPPAPNVSAPAPPVASAPPPPVASAPVPPIASSAAQSIQAYNPEEQLGNRVPQEAAAYQ